MSGTISLLTIVHGRRPHLHNLLRGVADQQLRPHEIIIVFMNEDIPDRLPDPGCTLRPIQLNSTHHHLPLAAARNRAAAAATGDILAFLDVDCIPAPHYLERLQAAVRITHGLVMGEVRYLPEGAAAPGWTFDSLDLTAQPHPRRPQLPPDRETMTLPYPLFWSLAFGLYATDFARLGGFDEQYVGYGGEDTDFAFNARASRLPFYGCGACAYHQYHPVYSPPYNHLEDIVANASRFHSKWQMWPMETWLKQFEREDLIRWEANHIEILRQPDAELVEGALRDTLFG